MTPARPPRRMVPADTTRHAMHPTLRPLLLAALLLPAAAFGQGSLTPPGAPAPTMKTLDQIEARTPLAGGTTALTIATPGSYYLTGNLTVASGDAIAISVANVTLDLGGFTVSTTAATAAGYAVKISARRVTVANGVVAGTGTVSGATFSGGGFANGVVFSGAVPQAVVVRGVLVTGCSTTGISASLVEDCNAQNIGGTGINGRIVARCQVDSCGGTGINSAVVTDCLGAGYAAGITCTTLSNSFGTLSDGGSNTGTALTATTAQNCVGSISGGNGTGIKAATATGCQGTSDQGQGLNANAATNCEGTSNTGTGVFAVAATNSHGVSGSGAALYAVTATGCMGSSTSGQGVLATVGENCDGETTSGNYGISGEVYTNSRGYCVSGGGTGMFGYSILSCEGLSDSGNSLYCTTAANCFTTALRASGPGLRASNATGCYSSNYGSGPALTTTIAIGSTVSGGALSATYRYNMP